MITKKQADAFVEDEWEKVYSELQDTDYDDFRNVFAAGVKTGVRLAAHRIIADLERAHPDARVIEVGGRKKTPAELIDDIKNYREDGMRYLASELWEKL